MSFQNRFFNALLWLALLGFIANKAFLPSGTMFNALGSSDFIVLCPGNAKSQLLIDSIQRFKQSKEQAEHQHHAHHHHHHHHHMMMSEQNESAEDIHAHHKNQVDAGDTCSLAAAFAVDSSDISFAWVYQFALMIRQVFAQYQRDILQAEFIKPLTRASPFFSFT